MTEGIQCRPEGNGLKIINAGLFRMATKSMAQAYTTLGFKTHHGLMEDVMDTPWTLIEQAAEATWPSAPGATSRPPFKREDWDAMWVRNTTPSRTLPHHLRWKLIKAYPEAKVVVVQRDFDMWWPTFKAEILDRVMIQPMATINGLIGWHMMGIRAVQAMRKVHFGFYDAVTKEEITEHAREKYDKYFKEIRKLVPPERRLEYKMGDGWEPLCDFLGVEPPPHGTPFPRLNNRGAHEEEAGGREKKFIMSAVKFVLPWVVIVGGVFLYNVYR